LDCEKLWLSFAGYFFLPIQVVEQIFNTTCGVFWKGIVAAAER